MQSGGGSSFTIEGDTFNPIDGFFGVVALDGNFSEITFQGVSGIEGTGLDNFVYASSSTPVPFEVSPTLGLLTIGGIWGISRLRKKRGVSKITK